MWLMKRGCDLRWQEPKQGVWTEGGVVLLTELLRPHQERRTALQESERHPCGWAGEEGLGGKCWKDGHFRKVVIKALHLWRVSLGRGISVVCRAFIISLNRKFTAASPGRSPSHLTPRDPGLHSRQFRQPLISEAEEPNDNQVRTWPEVHRAGTRRHRRHSRAANSNCPGAQAGKENQRSQLSTCL